jgi:hypothetical protein
VLRQSVVLRRRELRVSIQSCSARGPIPPQGRYICELVGSLLSCGDCVLCEMGVRRKACFVLNRGPCFFDV